MEHEADFSTISTASKPNLAIRFWGFFATVLSVLYTAVLVFPTALAAAIGRGHWVTPIMRLWSWLIFVTCGITAEVEGRENLIGLDACILVSNHQSLFDILALIYLVPRETRFVAKREIMKIPVLGFAMKRSGNVIIDRQSGGHGIRRAVDAMRQGYSICVFAEGHRHSDNQVHEFSDGAAWLAIAAKRACVPIAISGTAALMPRGARFVRPGLRIRLVIGRPIATAGLHGRDRTELTGKLEAAVRELLRSEV
jgi:1-acyl-sn-glycerol-3-phosphate acyltransferase